MKLLGSTKNKITKDKNSENVPHLEITEVVLVHCNIGENVPHLETTKVVLVHCNIVNNDYQKDSRVLYTFVPNTPFGSLLDITAINHIF